MGNKHRTVSCCCIDLRGICNFPSKSNRPHDKWLFGKCYCADLQFDMVFVKFLLYRNRQCFITRFSEHWRIKISKPYMSEKLKFCHGEKTILYFLPGVATAAPFLSQTHSSWQNLYWRVQWYRWCRKRHDLQWYRRDAHLWRTSYVSKKRIASHSVFKEKVLIIWKRDVILNTATLLLLFCQLLCLFFQ